MSEPKPRQDDDAQRTADADGPDIESLLAAGGQPDPAPIARVREKVMAQYGDALATGAFLAPRHQAAHTRRYLARLGLAMGAALAVVALVGATHDRPGEPFYPFRIAFEEFALPSGAARWPAQLQMLEQRWTEVTAAAQAGDAAALQAAWTAYQADLGDLVGADGQPGSDPAALQLVLDADAARMSATADQLTGPVASFEATVVEPAVKDHQVMAAPAGAAPQSTSASTSAPTSAASTGPTSAPTSSPATPRGNGNGNAGGNGNGNGNGIGNGNGNGNGKGGGNGGGNGNGHGHK